MTWCIIWVQSLHGSLDGFRHYCSNGALRGFRDDYTDGALGRFKHDMVH